MVTWTVHLRTIVITVTVHMHVVVASACLAQTVRDIPARTTVIVLIWTHAAMEPVLIVMKVVSPPIMAPWSA